MSNGGIVTNFRDVAFEKIRQLCDPAENLDCHAADLIAAGWTPSGIATEMLQGIDQELQAICDVNPEWLEIRRNTKIRRTRSLSNVSGCLAEIRAYGDLLRVFPSSSIQTSSDKKKGPDFRICLGKDLMLIQVSCPDIDRNDLEYRDIINGETSCHRIQRRKGDPSEESDPCQTIQGRKTCQGSIAWKIATHKIEDEDQEIYNNFSVLWMDFSDFTRWRRTLVLDESMPLVSGGGSYTSGYLWLAFYGKEHDPIFDQLNCGTLKREISKMDFDGKFQYGSLFDTAIIRSSHGKIAMSNHKSVKVLTKPVLDAIGTLPDLREEFSWREGGTARKSLELRVARCRKKLKRLAEAFSRPLSIIERLRLIDSIDNQPWD